MHLREHRVGAGPHHLSHLCLCQLLVDLHQRLAPPRVTFLQEQRLHKLVAQVVEPASRRTSSGDSVVSTTHHMVRLLKRYSCLGARVKSGLKFNGRVIDESVFTINSFKMFTLKCQSRQLKKLTSPFLLGRILPQISRS